MSTDSSNITATDAGQWDDSPRSVRARVNEAFLHQLAAEGLMDEERRERLRVMLDAERPPKAEEFISLFQEPLEEAAQ